MPETYILNARIHTMRRQPVPGGDAAALALRDGVVSWIGAADEARARMRETPAAEVLDAGGRTILPGLVEAHMHPPVLGEALTGVPCLPPAATSLADILRLLAERARAAPAGTWLTGFGYDEHRLSEGRAPRRADLDRAAPSHPVVLHRACGHIVAANSAALAAAGIDETTPDPPGGEIVRDAAGRPTGILKESARELVLRALPPRDARRVAASLAVASRALLAHGVTSAVDMSVEDDDEDTWAAYRMATEAAARAAGGGSSPSAAPAFHPRAFLYHMADQLEEVLADRPRHSGDPARLRLAGFKIFADGSVSGATAAMTVPYLPGGTGILTTPPDVLRERVAAVHRAGFQVAVHAMGDRAVDLVSAAIAEAEASAEGPSAMPQGPSRRPPHRIEHATFTGPEALARIVRHGIMLLPQPVFLFAEGRSYLDNVGTERTARAYPLRTWRAAGAAFALTSDAPMTTWSDPANPWLGMYAAAARTMWDGRPLGEGETIPAAEALYRYAAVAARALGAEEEIGSLAPGRRADFIVLGEDPLEVPLERWPAIRPLATFMDGRPVAGDVAALRPLG